VTLPTPIVWNTRNDGVVEVSTDGAIYTVPVLAASELVSMRRMLGHEAIVIEIADHFDVPVPWVMGLGRHESGGDPRAVNPEKLPGEADDGAGLLQITGALRGGRTNEQLFNVRTNLTIGVGLIASIRQVAFDLPATCSMFNAGQPCITPDNRYVPCAHAPPGSRPSHRPWQNEAWLANGRSVLCCSRWGFACSPGHIDSVVRGSNWYILHRGAISA
jgi:hypothetical protein